MKVKKMWANMLEMIHWEKEGSYNEPVAVVPWEEWEKMKDAIISLVGTTERKVTEDERLDAELKMFSMYQSLKEAEEKKGRHEQ